MRRLVFLSSFKDKVFYQRYNKDNIISLYIDKTFEEYDNFEKERQRSQGY